MASKAMLLLFSTLLLVTTRASSYDLQLQEELETKAASAKGLVPAPAPYKAPIVTPPPTPVVKPPTPVVKPPSPPTPVVKPPTPVVKPPTPVVKPPPPPTDPVVKPPTPLVKPPPPPTPVVKPPTPVVKPPTPVVKPPPPPTPVVQPPGPVPPVQPPPYLPPMTPVRSKKDCIPLCGKRCELHSRKRVCMRACMTCCDRCRCVPPGTFGNRERCGKCYTDMLTHGNRSKCP